MSAFELSFYCTVMAQCVVAESTRARWGGREDSCNVAQFTSSVGGNLLIEILIGCSCT